MRVILVHGFNVRDGGLRSIDRLSPYLSMAGFETDIDSADYGWQELIAVRFCYKKAVRRIARALEKADAAVAHSNGANYVNKALKYVSSPKVIIDLSPALNSKLKIHPMVKHMHVFHTRHDNAVKAAKWLIAHPWGDMGAKGYHGRDFRVTNYDWTRYINGHSDWFKEDNILKVSGKVNEILSEYVK